MIIKIPPVYDVSHWKYIPNFATLDPKPVMVIMKATEGNAYVDSRLAEYAPDIRAAGYARGFYHFHRKASYSSSAPYSQAKHFCETIRPYVVDGDILILDLEEGGETAKMMIDWFTYVQNQYPNNLVMLYSRANILDNIPMFIQTVRRIAPQFVDAQAVENIPLNAIPMTTAEREFMKQIPTWSAGYPYDPDIYDSIPSFYIPDQSKYGPPWLWQYTDKGKVNGIYGNVDATYLGDVDCNWISPVLLGMIEQPTEEPMKEYVTGLAKPGAGYTLRVRSGPGTTFSIIGSLAHDQAFTGWLENGWIEIDYQGQTGYIMASWTEYTVTDPPTQGEKAKIEIVYNPADVEITLTPQ